MHGSESATCSAPPPFPHLHSSFPFSFNASLLDVDILDRQGYYFNVHTLKVLEGIGEQRGMGNQTSTGHGQVDVERLIFLAEGATSSTSTQSR